MQRKTRRPNDIERLIPFFNEDFCGRDIQNLSAQVMQLFAEDSHKAITLLICTNGGVLGPAVGFYEMVKDLNIKLNTRAYSEVSSAGLILYLAGLNRHARPKTKFLFHPSVWEVSGSTSKKKSTRDIRHQDYFDADVYDIITRETRLTEQRIISLEENNDYIFAPEAEEYGIVKSIIRIPGFDRGKRRPSLHVVPQISKRRASSRR